MSFGDIVTGVGTAVNDLFQGEGNAAAANSYTGAATIATQNAQLSAASTRIQATQEARTVTQALGTQTADVAGAGFTESGSALDLLASSASQGALAKSLVNIQGAMNENSYAAQAGAYSGEAAAANAAGTGSTIAAIGALGGALVNGSGALVSAGKTVVQGYNYLFGGSGATVTGTAAASDPAITVGATGLGDVGVAPTVDSFVGPGGAVSSVSATDAAIAGNLPASTSTALDTSGTLGDAVSSVTGAVSDAFSSIGGAISSGADAITSGISSVATDVLGSGVTDLIGAGLSDLIPGLGLVSLVNMIPGVDNIPVVGPVLSGIGDVVNTVVGGVVSAVSDIGNAIGGFFGSVICTALYKRGMLTRSIWHGAQRYGRDMAPEHVYEAYLLWGRPIADMITKSEWFAKIAAPVFIPWANELAVLAGEKTAKSTLAGRVIFKVTYAFSALLGKAIMYRRSRHVVA